MYHLLPFGPTAQHMPKCCRLINETDPDNRPASIYAEPVMGMRLLL